MTKTYNNIKVDDIDAVIGLLKIKRILKDRTYVEYGYKYKTELQTKMLTEILKITQYPNSSTRETLGILLNLNPRTIQIWFQNARQGMDRQISKSQVKK